MIGLSRAGLLSDETAQSYEQTVEDYVKQAGSVRLHHAKSTENSRAILGLTAAGYNAANMAGVDLTAGLTDMAYLRAQGTNGPIWALIALDCHGYDIPQCADGEEQTTCEGLVAEILSYQCSDGGVAMNGSRTNPICTCTGHVPLTSLAPISGGDRHQGRSLTRRDQQSECQSGRWRLMRGAGARPTASCPASAHYMLRLCTGAGHCDTAADIRFVKNGATRPPLDGLFAFASGRLLPVTGDR